MVHWVGFWGTLSTHSGGGCLSVLRIWVIFMVFTRNSGGYAWTTKKLSKSTSALATRANFPKSTNEGGEVQISHDYSSRVFKTKKRGVLRFNIRGQELCGLLQATVC